MYRQVLGVFAATLLAPSCVYAGPPPASAAQAPATVEVQTVKASTLDRNIEAVGSLISNESVILTPEIAGRVTEISFEEGQEVKKGDVLVRLDNSIYTAQLAQAKAALGLSQSNYERAAELNRKKIGAVSVVQETVAKRNADTAAVDLAQAQLDKTVIKAPFDGIVGLRQISVGDYVTAGQQLVNLESIDPLKVNFKISEVYLSSLKTGQAIKVAIDAFPNQEFTGEVYAIDPLIDTAGRTVSLRAKLPNPEKIMRPGLFARLKLVVERKEGALMIDEQALNPQGNEQFVYKVVDGKAVTTKIVTGQRRAGQVEVTEGLKVGDVVITAGQMKIRPDAPVKITEPKSDTATPATGTEGKK